MVLPIKVFEIRNVQRKCVNSIDLDKEKYIFKLCSIDLDKEKYIFKLCSTDLVRSNDD